MIIVLFIGIVGFACTIVFFEWLADTRVDKIRTEYPEIKSVETSSIELGPRTLDISFYDGKRIILENVNKQLKGDIRVKRIGEYGFVKYGRYSFSETIDAGILENELSIRLNNVNDIIENYILQGEVCLVFCGP
ncbi:MAG: hypothetical protein LBJ31_01950 [Treponema sp.]|jgi:hypothetical protein|nr:hypothetical protein [Treponema sp.]